MKKTIALALSIVLVLASLSCIAQAEEVPKFVTIQMPKENAATVCCF